MKVAVTGHTRGIGKALFDYFALQNNNVVGFSKTTGYNITDYSSRKRILEEIKDFDIFVNNAYNNYDHFQLLLLKEVFDQWSGQQKVIINISSRYTEDTTNIYSQTKLKQDIFCQKHLFDLPKIINIKPGLVDTDRVKQIKGNRLTTAQVVEVVDFSLKNNVQSVTFGK